MADEEASKSRHTPQLRDVDEDHLCKESDGISILEVYSVTYLGSSPVKPADQIGSIRMKINDSTLSYLYYENKVDRSKPSIKYGDQLCIKNVGPICSFQKLKLKFDLFSSEYKNLKLEVDAEPPEHGDWLAKPSIKSVDGFSDISVLLGCFPNATVANIKVVLPHSHATPNVYGAVIATNSKFDYPSCTNYLFSRNSASPVQVGHNGVLPLSKSRVGVPLDSKLYVDFSLFCDDSHYKGTASFTPKDTDSYLINDYIQVKVVWNCGEDPNFSDEDSNFTDEDSNSTDEDPYFPDYFDSAPKYDSEDDTEKEI